MTTDLERLELKVDMIHEAASHIARAGIGLAEELEALGRRVAELEAAVRVLGLAAGYDPAVAKNDGGE